MPHAPRSRTLLVTVLATAAVLGTSVLAGAPVARAGGPAAGTTVVVGTLVHAFAEHEREDPRTPTAADAPLSFVKTPDGNAVRVPTTQVSKVPAGATVSVTLGKEVVDQAATKDGLHPARQVLAADVVAPAPPTAAGTSPTVSPVTDQVTVVMAVPRGGTQNAVTLQQVVDQVNGPVADFWSQQSGGAVHLGVTGQVDWYQASVDCSNPYALWNEAATRAAWAPGPNKHLMVYLPKDSAGCAYGLAEVGSSISSGGELYVTDVVTSVMAHELGHNFGLGHSSEIQCDNSVDAGNCTTQAYRDYYDVMAASWQQLGSLTVGQAARIGLLPAGQQQTVTWPAPGATVALAPVSGTTGTRALKLVDPNGRVYWLEYRPAAGRDDWLGTAADWPGLQPGVLLRQDGNDPTTNTSLLLDGTPSPASGWSGDMNTVLPIAGSVSFDGGMFTATVTATSPTGATVRVSTGPDMRAWSPARNRLPVGNWEEAAVFGTTLTVGGWALDPDSPQWSGQVHVYVDGVGTPVQANISRPDVGPHGFGFTTTVTPGYHSVCLYAIDDELPTTNTFYGCRQIQSGLTRPWGNWEVASVSAMNLTVAGWAFDPDSPTTSGYVHVYVDGVGTPVRATAARPDIAAAFPAAGPAHGFGWSVPVGPGVHTVCAYAIDNEMPWTNTFFGCRTITAGLSRPMANWEGLSSAPGTVSVAGWALDPDSPPVASPVHVYIDGVGYPVAAGDSRADLAAAFPWAGAAHGFHYSHPASSGRHTLCLYAIDVQQPWTNTFLGCRGVTVP